MVPPVDIDKLLSPSLGKLIHTKKTNLSRVESQLLQKDAVRLVTASCLPFTSCLMVDCLISIQICHGIRFVMKD